MRIKVQPVFVVSTFLMTSLVLGAQQPPTSRQIPFNNVPTTLTPCAVPPDPACPKPVNVTVQLWQDATSTVPADLIFSEVQPSAGLDGAGNISFVFGSQTAGGLNPTNFPSGSSRFLDVVDPATGASVLAARIPLNANAFALSPGPAGPQGAPGAPGRDGQIQSVAAGDASIAVVGGTGPNPTLSVAPNGVDNSKIADGALSPAKIAGAAATLGSNIFGGTQVINTSAASGLTSESTFFNGAGVIGDGHRGSRAAGVWGRTTIGLGVTGTATTGAGTGVWGEFRGPGSSGTGVLGTTQQGGYGVRGETDFGFGVFGTSNSGVGIHGESRNIAVRGSSPAGWGVQGTSDGVGVRGDSASGYAMYAAGNTGQAIDKGGWNKAMLLVRYDGTIELCYNSTLTGDAASTPPCGFTVSNTPCSGISEVNFGFQINSRFLSVTNARNQPLDIHEVPTLYARPISTQIIRVLSTIVDPHSFGPCPDTDFYLIVF